MINVPDFSPIAFSLLGISVRWYALAYMAGFLLALSWLKRFSPVIKASKFWDDLLSYAIFGVILGGRLGYVLFYNLPHFIQFPLDIFKIWQGGMSFHGGMLGLALATFLYARKTKMPYFYLQDRLAVVAPIGLFFGRIANFINQELMGAPTDFWTGVRFGGHGIYRHPSPLYEAILEGFVLFIIMHVLFRQQWMRERLGTLTGVFLIFYGLFRFCVEFVRLPDIQIGYLAGNWLTMGHILSIPMILGGLFLIYFMTNKND